MKPSPLALLAATCSKIGTPSTGGGGDKTGSSPVRVVVPGGEVLYLSGAGDAVGILQQLQGAGQQPIATLATSQQQQTFSLQGLENVSVGVQPSQTYQALTAIGPDGVEQTVLIPAGQTIQQQQQPQPQQMEPQIFQLSPGGKTIRPATTVTPSKQSHVDASANNSLTALNILQQMGGGGQQISLQNVSASSQPTIVQLQSAASQQAANSMQTVPVQIPVNLGNGQTIVQTVHLQLQTVQGALQAAFQNSSSIMSNLQQVATSPNQAGGLTVLGTIGMNSATQIAPTTPPGQKQSKSAQKSIASISTATTANVVAATSVLSVPQIAQQQAQTLVQQQPTILNVPSLSPINAANLLPLLQQTAPLTTLNLAQLNQSAVAVVQQQQQQHQQVTNVIGTVGGQLQQVQSVLLPNGQIVQAICGSVVNQNPVQIVGANGSIMNLGGVSNTRNEPMTINVQGLQGLQGLGNVQIKVANGGDAGQIMGDFILQNGQLINVSGLTSRSVQSTSDTQPTRLPSTGSVASQDGML